MSQPEHQESIRILRLLAFDGPNVYGPHPGVRMLVRCDQDRSKRLRNAIKDGAQFVGLMLAQLEVTSRVDADSWLIQTGCITNAPQLAADLCTLIVEGIAAAARNDEEWDGDTPLFELQERSRRDALPAAVLQLLAEARSRGISTLRLPDGRVLIGSGVRGRIIDPNDLRNREHAPALPWEQLGNVPLVAVTGEHQRSAAVMDWAVRMAGSGRIVRAADHLIYHDCARLLADPQAEVFVLGLQTDDLIQRGIAFDRCNYAVVTDRAGTRPPVAADDEEWLRALGLPLLLSGDTVYLGNDPLLNPLRPYALQPIQPWPLSP